MDDALCEQNGGLHHVHLQSLDQTALHNMIQVLKLDDAVFVEDTLDVHIVASQSHFGLANNNFLLFFRAK